MQTPSCVLLLMLLVSFGRSYIHQDNTRSLGESYPDEVFSWPSVFWLCGKILHFCVQSVSFLHHISFKVSSHVEYSEPILDEKKAVILKGMSLSPYRMKRMMKRLNHFYFAMEPYLNLSDMMLFNRPRMLQFLQRYNENRWEKWQFYQKTGTVFDVSQPSYNSLKNIRYRKENAIEKREDDNWKLLGRMG